MRGGVVLCYHLVGGGVGGPVDLDVDVFDAHLDRLRHLSGSQAIRSLADVAASGQGIALTFDDAFENFADIIWPRLQAAKLPATLFVPTGFIDGESGSPLSTAPDLRPCTWEQLRGMAKAGLQLGSHTVSHRNLRRVPLADVDAEFVGAKKRISEMTGQTPWSLCYPQAKWSPAVELVARRRYGVIVTGGGVRTFARRAWRVPRTSVVRGGPSLNTILRWPIVPREWLADKVRQRRA